MTTYAILQIIIMTAVTHAVRVIPLLAFRRPIKSRFIRSFLYYVPYASLAVMTFPAMLHATDSIWSGALSFIVGLVLAYRNVSLPKMAAACVGTVLISEFLLKMFHLM